MVGKFQRAFFNVQHDAASAARELAAAKLLLRKSLERGAHTFAELCFFSIRNHWCG
jgi:hypothetical protein